MARPRDGGSDRLDRPQAVCDGGQRGSGVDHARDSCCITHPEACHQRHAWFEHVDINKAKEVLGGKVCIMGSVPMSFMVGGTPEQVKERCKELIDVAGKDGGYIMSAAAVMDDSKPENVRAMMDFTREYGRY